MSDRPEKNGGEGGGPDHFTRSELRVLDRAIKKRWHLTNVSYEQVPAELEKMATGKRQSARNKIAAARVLVTMDRCNLEQEKLEVGETLNVHVSGTLTVEQKRSALLAALCQPGGSGGGVGGADRNGHAPGPDAPGPDAGIQPGGT